MEQYVNYEDFGAIGDGIHDDMEAIIAAHAYANEHRLPVRTAEEATYYIGPRPLTAYIETDVDWNTSRFTIDDTEVTVEDREASCFIVRSALTVEPFAITELHRDQKQLDVHPSEDCVVTVYNDNIRHFIRYGLNQNSGEAATDTFVLHKDGSIYGGIDWDYDTITQITAFPIDEKPLQIKGGVFTTFANRAESKYTYYRRNISIKRSRVTVDGLIHYIAGEVGHGAPYGGFLHAEKCAYITLQNCFNTGHKIYETIGSAGLPVMMGSYDILANRVVDLHIRSCRVNNITDRTRWGVIASNYCKNLIVEDCIFSRLDAHQGVSGEYTIRNSQMGWQGINAIGRGVLTLDHVTAYGNNLVCFRPDYGSTWEGDVVIRNCRWIPACGQETRPSLFGMSNNGMHNFGYPCHMPRSIQIDGLIVEDTRVPEDYTGLRVFMDPDGDGWGAQPPIGDVRPYAMKPCEIVEIKGLQCLSGKPVTICDNEEAFCDTEFKGV